MYGTSPAMLAGMTDSIPPAAVATIQRRAGLSAAERDIMTKALPNGLEMSRPGQPKASIA